MVIAEEVSAGIFVLRYQAMDLNICVVRGDGALLVVDTGSSPAEAAEIEADLRQLGSCPLVGVVNTHAHFDHTFGNQHFGPASAFDVPIYGHHRLPAHLIEHEGPRLQRWRLCTGDEPPRDWADVVITPPTNLVTDRQAIVVGGRVVELWPLGAAHTDTDLVVHVPDADTWIVGDLVEESGPPMYGSGCFPLDWPDAVAQLLEDIGASHLVIPGHGRPVPRGFVVDQLADLAAFAAQASACWSAGLSIDEALAADQRWPFPTAGLRLAVQRSYAALDARQH
ncbi:MAG: MBL fold metallo-hydrolase [Actinomycetota bacterium]|nr:MBL fold metallo-hydrolase [Actinomycetota bacterium]MDQ2955716.1 MBL fold metallo-hydrolase [Actinomycetota bacterium]